jgi:hypothetical protein
MAPSIWHSWLSSALEESSPKTRSCAVCNFHVHTDSMILSWVMWTLLSPQSYYNGLQRSQMSNQGTAGKRRNLI